MDSTQLISYIEKLRRKRKITQEELLFSVVSRRQYLRYKKGEAIIPQDVLTSMCEKLGISLFDLYFGLNTELGDSYSEIKSNMTSIIFQDQADANFFEELPSSNKSFDKNSYELIKITDILINKNRGFIDDIQFLEQLSETIDYNTVMEKSLLTANEVIALSLMISVHCLKTEEIIRKLSTLIENRNSMISIDTTYLLHIHYLIANYYRSINNTAECLKYAIKGIERCKKYQSISHIDDFYYLLATEGLTIYGEDYSNQYKQKLFDIADVLGNTDKWKEKIEKEKPTNCSESQIVDTK